MSRPDHTDKAADRLAAAFAEWASAPAGEKTPKLLVEVIDADGREVGRTELTHRQAEELAAGLAHADLATSSGWAIAHTLALWTVEPGDPVAAEIRFTDWRITDDDLDDGIKPTPIPVRIARHRIDDLTGFVTAVRMQLALARRWLLPHAQFSEGATVRVRTPPGKPPLAGDGHTGVVAYVKVSMPNLTLAQLNGVNLADVGFLYEVRLDVAGGEPFVLTLTHEEVEAP